MNLNPYEMFKVLGVETRLKIIKLLKSRGTMYSKEIAKELGLTQAAVSQHLKVLRLAGLVKNERRGYWIPYKIDEEMLENCCCMLVEVCTCGCIKAEKPDKENLHKSKLEYLVRYKKELEAELRKVSKRISELKKGRDE